MPDRMRQIMDRFLDFWNRYNRRQKTMVISGLAVVVIALAILATVLSRPVYQVITTCANYNEMSQVTSLLSENGYQYVTNEAAMTVSVKEADSINAKMLLSTSNIKVDGYGLEDALNSGISTPESDRLRKWQAYLESKLASDLEDMDHINAAQVTINLQDSTNSLFVSENGSSASVILSLVREIDDEEAENIAYLLKNAIPNLALKDITILSNTGENLYSGDSLVSGSVTSLNRRLKFIQQLNDVTATQIKNQVLSTGIYSDVKVVVNYDIDYSNYERISHEYSVPEGNEQGYYSESYIENSQGVSSNGGTPGTESNDEDTTYDISNGDGTSSSLKIEKYSYLVNELVTTETTSPGEIINDSSSISAVFTKNVVYNESEARALGYLEDMSWDEFKAANAETIQIEYDPDWITILANGSSIPGENISIVAYEKHWFYDDPSSSRPISFYIQFLLAAAILGLLAFVVFRSSRPITVEETEPELSVEQMLASTRETQQTVEDIDLQEKSEVRKAIEKFVDENPESVALLLRNWLDDGWD